ncbi:reverse transcriptase domain-containing protein [Tanacetum coccineum]
MKFLNVPSTSVKLMLFTFSLEGAARMWLKKEPPRLTLTWDDLVSKFINKFFPPSKTTNLRNEITGFQQRFEETFPHHGFLEIHQIDTFYNALNSNDQDSLNSVAGGNFLDKMPRECLRIIEIALTTNVSELKNMMKTMLIDKQKAQAPAPVKAAEQSCITCGGSHSYQHCSATERNVYQDNIQEYVAQAAVANFNQGNNNTRPPLLSNQMGPPGQVYQPPTNQPPVYQVPPYQVPTPQIQGVSRTDFETYIKANDAVLKNVQNQGQNLQNQMTNLTDLFTNIIKSNTASTSSTGTLPSQYVTNPRQQINAITTRSGKTLEEPLTPLVPTPVVSTPQKENEPNPGTLMENVQSLNLENTAQVPPPREKDSIFIEIPKPKVKKTVNVEIQEPNSPKPNSYQPKLPYPEWIGNVIERTEYTQSAQKKLEEIAIITVNAECSAIIMNKVPKKLEDPGKFLIPCALQDLKRTSALADSGASINLLPHSIYKQLELRALKPTRMTLELANRSITHPMGRAEDIVVRVDGFTFLADFVVVNFEPDPRVPIILRRPFLRTAKALIDLYEETLTFKNDPFSGSTTTHSDNPSPSSSPMKTILHEENFQVYSNPLFEFDDTFKSNSINLLFDEMEENIEIENTNVSNEPVLPQTPLSNKDECFDLGNDIDEIEEFLAMEISKEYDKDFYDSKGDVLFLDNLLCDKPTSNPFPQNESNHETFSSRDDPLHHEFTGGIIINSSTIASPSTIIESLPTSHILVEDSEPIYEEIDLVPGPDEVIPPGVENDDSEDEDNSTLLPENESSIFEPSPSRPPPEPPDDCLKFKPILAIKEEFYHSEKMLPLNEEDVNSFTFVWTFLPYFTYHKESPLFLSFRSEDFVFDPGIVTFHFSYQKPVAFSRKFLSFTFAFPKDN